MTLARIYLTGRMAIEGTKLIDEGSLPGVQGRVALAALSLTPHPIGRDHLAEIMWGEDIAEGWEKSLAPILSKLRRAIADAGISGASIVSSTGAVELRREEPVWVDVLDAVTALDAAEGELRTGNHRSAWVGGAVATAVFRRPFLPGASSDWVNQQRRSLHNWLLRSYEVVADSWEGLGQPQQAAIAARQLISIDPFRESGYVRLIRAHAAQGNRAEAVRVFSEAREFLVTELGVEPSDRLQEAYEEII